MSRISLSLCHILMATAMLLQFFACGKKEVSPEEMASQTAKLYYEQLIAGDVASFVAGMEGEDSIVASYRAQLETNMRMFLAQQKKERNGIVRVENATATSDSLSHTVNVLLQICFGDSTREQVVVPMVECNGIWKMK